MRKIKIILALLIIINSNFSYAEVTKGGHFACLSEDLFDQITSASVSNDKNAVQYLIGHGCVISKPNIQLTVLDRTWTGKVKARVYLGDSALVLWMAKENVVD